MKLEKAIKGLEARVDGEFNIEGVDDYADMKLGIEALERVRYNRGHPSNPRRGLLPGETEE